MELMIVFTFRLLDTIMASLKNLFLIHRKYFLSGLLNFWSTFFALSTISQMVKSDNKYTIFAICIASFFGTYIPGLLLDLTSKDKVFVFEITPPDSETGKQLADILRDKNIPVMTYKGYRNRREVLCVRAFSRNKEESNKIQNMIPQTCKYVILKSQIIAD
ncbi:MAG: hypothetical protein ACPLRZ_03765 [Thermovenabulum sp.]|uniref:hypothetical protein n=1 Tax=Thermovenabulum sp. TaxID=3100335 RepID=UPI003C7DD281